MRSLSPSRRTEAARALRLVAALVCATALVPLAPVPGRAAQDAQLDAVVRSDAAVRAAQDDLRRAQRQQDAVTRKLDEAAAVFEEARGLAERLEDEAEQLTAEQRAREKANTATRERTTDRVVAAYLMPSRQLSLSQFVLGASDAATALHMVGVIDHLGHRGDEAIGRIDRVERLSADEVRQQHLVTAGARSATLERQRSAGRLQVALDDATTVVTQADRTLAQAEADAEAREMARRREEAERRAREERERARLAALAATTDSGPPPAVDGLVCPVGRPNGFIDSWGFPRSGGRSHRGVDMFAAQGTPLYAVADGTASVGSNRLGGLTVDIRSDAGDRYYYAHLSTITVPDGARVRTGDVIGAVGTTGNAAGTPPHLHWQYHPGGGSPVNPYPLAMALCR